MAKEREYLVEAEGQVWVRTTVRASSKAEAIRKAKQARECDWDQSSVPAVGLQCLTVLDG